MKKITIASFIFILLITGCSSTGSTNYSNTYNPDTDFQYMYFMQNYSTKIASTTSGYYVLNGQFLYYMDKSSMSPVLLDSRPNSTCSSTDLEELKQCSAFVNNDGIIGSFLAYSNEKLYTVEHHTYVHPSLGRYTKPTLMEISKDGSERKIKFTFDIAPQAIALHRGILYYSKQDYDKETNSSYQVLSLYLNSNSSKPVAIFNGKREMGTIIDIIPYGKQVYIHEAGDYLYRTLRYDIEHKSISQIFTEENQPESASLATIFGDKLFYTIFDGEPTSENSTTIRTSNLDGDANDIAPIEINIANNNYSDSSYLYSRPVWFYTNSEAFPDIEHKMTVFDKDFNIVDTIDLSYLPLHHFINGGDDDYMFVQHILDNKMFTLILDKKAIGTGKANFDVLIESPIIK